MSAVVELTDVTRNFGSGPVVEQLSLSVEEGEFLCLLGPSGCGKTTTLRMIAGYDYPTSGTISIRGQDSTRTPPQRRNIGMVFQSYALFPHMSVGDNVAFGPKMHGHSRSEARRRATEALELVGLADTMKRKPAALSGGQQQRVALARALAFDPSLLLLDEPLSNLDARLRTQMREEIRRIQRETGITALLVTHDQEEALAVADRIAILNAGRIAQLGTPQEVFERPATRFVADFLGYDNIIPVDGELTAVRPEYVAFDQRPDRGPGWNSYPARLKTTTYRGTEIGGLAAVQLPDGEADIHGLLDEDAVAGESLYAHFENRRLVAVADDAATTEPVTT